MIARLLDGVPKRALVLLGLLLAFLLVAPLFVGNYILSVLILVLYFAYTGQAWNVMMGFAGQLSLGHSLYVGLGAYTAAALYVHFGIGPWVGVWIAIIISMAAGLVIGFLAFRFGIGGVYFALLTIAFAEFTRVGFDHFMWVNGSGGFFLPVTQYSMNDPLNLRGSPMMFYYILLAITVLAFIFCRWLLTGRIGYYWLAIREEPEAAQTLGINIFRYKMIAVAISSGMTALSGVFFAFYYNNLFPEQIFSMNRSIELILGPIIGGVGSLFGPILGAFVLTALAEALNDIMVALGYELPGVKLLFYGFCLLAVVMWLPNGIWPPLRKWLKLEDRS
ncbi:branched-chain amino acid ABC transporter permease [Ferrovibrio terrae]|uniref:Branched-chain amino acid ABC transporter permease n=1 Tax=Ferrovibrio terrae TaxID=2594003 RepID=A0A516H1W9_9PROT|nr:branched-chain amino acid ABC transporter permease [Ferrovibrio terrae]QDO97764.1 branched-chain amino acid ABC transporter permease [Ferrovibrio terrae]